MDTMTTRHKVTRAKTPTPSDGNIPFTLVALDDAWPTDIDNISDEKGSYSVRTPNHGGLLEEPTNIVIAKLPSLARSYG